MKRRISLVVTAVSVCALLAVGSGIALAASAKTTVLKCKIYMSTVSPKGASYVSQPASSGRQYGPNVCAQSGFGSGIVADEFTVPISGDFVGTYTQYFPTGSIHGKFDLAPEPTSLSSTNFTSEAFKGPLTVTGGTGTLKGITSKKGAGVMTCTSPDTVHMTCREYVKIT